MYNLVMDKKNLHETDANNIRFIEHLLGEEGQNGLELWYNNQPKFRQEYVIELLDEYIRQLTELRQNLVSNNSDAQHLIEKIMKKI